MDTDKVFHMKGGCGDTSYSQNSSLQKRAADKVKHITAEALAGLMRERRPKSLGMADLGCSSGPNTLSNIKHLLRVLDRSCSDKSCSDSTVEFRVYLNDLPTNDFNTVFQALPDFYRELGPRPGPVYVAAYPGSFYGRLFPDHSLHFVYSANSLHWLSRVPLGLYDENGSSINKKSIYITKRSPPKVIRAYSKQFQEDFSLFLSSRSEEVITGGRMVIILLGATTSHHLDRADSFFWDILYQSFATLVAQGEVEEEKLDSYEVHFYAPSKEELEDAVRKDGCFKMEVADMFETEKDRGSYPSYGTAVAKTVRSIQESMIAHHFGDAILDKLFDHYARMIDEELAKDDIKTMTTVLVLTKL